jgi:hypothetical protein
MGDRTQFFLVVLESGARVIFHRDEALAFCTPGGVWQRSKDEFRLPAPLRKRLNWYFHEFYREAPMRYVPETQLQFMVARL